MKKLFTLAMALFVGFSLGYAQDDEADELDETVQFAYEDGTVVPNGSVVTVATLEETPYGDHYVNSGLYLKNTSENRTGIQLSMTATNLHSGAVQFCALMDCASYADTSTHVKHGVLSPNQQSSMQFEWFPGELTEEGIVFKEGDYGTTTAQLHVDVVDFTGSGFSPKYGDVIGVGPSITVNFVYAEPTKVYDVADLNAKPVARYNAAGQLINAPAHGLNIIKMSNGKTIKQLLK